MFSSGDHSTCAITQNTTKAPMPPASVAIVSAGIASQRNSDVSRYPVPPNQARNAIIVAKLNGETPPRPPWLA
jgi:hypothetical protein